MKSFQLEGSLRTDLGKKAAKALRVDNSVPAVLYGAEKAETLHFVVKDSAIQKLLYTPEVFLVDLTIDGKAYKAILKDIQFHPVTDNVLHLDFFQIFEDKPVTIQIPVILEGLAKGVKQGGKMSLDLRKLKVRALYNNLPEKLHVDVTKLALGKSIQVVDLNFEGLEILNAPNAVVCRVQLTRAARGAAAKGGASAADEEDEDEE